MKIDEVGYLGIDAKHVDEWRSFAADYIGFEVRPLGEGCLGLRMDQYPWRFFVRPAERDGIGFIGLKLTSLRELDAARGELIAAGLTVHDSSSSERTARGVQHMLWATDPDGNRVEFFVGRSADERIFSPGRPIGGFRTGDLGFGHVVIVTPNLEAMEQFYMGLVGFRLTDYFDNEIKVRFTRINPRHHSLALAKGPTKFLHHIMVEYKFMDDVGRLYDKALSVPGLIQATLGRHDNDQTLSFYSKTPGGFLMETGWGGRLVDDENWEPVQLWCMSLWGHERHWDTPENQAKQRTQKELAASRGLLAAVEVNDAGGFSNRNVT